MNLTSHTERKQRVDFGGEVMFKLRNVPTCQGVVRNVSEGGALLLSGTRVIKGTQMVVYLPLDLGSKKTLCMVSGKVVWMTEGKKSSQANAYGVKFDEDIPLSSRKLLRDFVSIKSGEYVPASEAPTKVKSRVSPHRD